MSREYEFRGLSKSGKWHYGSLVQADRVLPLFKHLHTKNWIVEESFWNGDWFNIKRKYNVIDETVGQYTGLKDINEEKIYDGDIVSASIKDIKSEFNVDTFEFEEKIVNWSIEYVNWNNYTGFAVYGINRRFNTKLNKSLIKARSLIKIGNIHQNKELLNV